MNFGIGQIDNVLRVVGDDYLICDSFVLGKILQAFCKMDRKKVQLQTGP
jgi:hypothetical protein